MAEFKIHSEEASNIYKGLKNLVQYKNKSEEDLWELAEKKAKENIEDVDIISKFKDKEERKVAKDLQRRYLAEYAIENVSDKNTLKEVIYLEVIQSRLQEKLNEHYQNDSKAIPFQLVEIIHKNSDAIIRLKNTLGLNQSKSNKNPYDVIQHLMKRAKKWREENQGTRSLVCPHCSKMIMLKIKTEAWEAQKHPFFRDKILYNKHLLQLYKDGKITKQDVANVLECSTDYIDWTINKIEKTNENNEDETKKQSTESKEV